MVGGETKKKISPTGTDGQKRYLSSLKQINRTHEFDFHRGSAIKNHLPVKAGATPTQARANKLKVKNEHKGQPL